MLKPRQFYKPIQIFVKQINTTFKEIGPKKG